MLLNEPHGTEGHCISAGTWLREPRATFLGSWNKAQRLGAVLLGCLVPSSPTETQHEHRSPAAQEKETLTHEVQRCGTFSPSKRGDVSQRVWRLFVDQLSSSPHSTPPMLSLTPAEAVPLSPFHNTPQADVCKTPMLITSKNQLQQSEATAEISPHAQGSATWRLPANGCGYPQLQRWIKSSEQVVASASPG